MSRRFRPFRWLMNLIRRKNPVYETMTCYTRGPWKVRVWREEPQFTNGPDKEVIQLLDKLFYWGIINVECTIDCVGSLPRVSAVEIVRADQGMTYYPDGK